MDEGLKQLSFLSFSIIDQMWVYSGHCSSICNVKYTYWIGLGHLYRTDSTLTKKKHHSILHRHASPSGLIIKLCETLSHHIGTTWCFTVQLFWRCKLKTFFPTLAGCDVTDACFPKGTNFHNNPMRKWSRCKVRFYWLKRNSSSLITSREGQRYC